MRLYSEYSDEYILECLEEGRDTYEPEAYSLLCDEARKRAIPIPEDAPSFDTASSHAATTQTGASNEASTYVERKVVFSTMNAMEANLAKGLLESHGIDVYVQDEVFSRLNPFLSPGMGGLKLTVPEHQVEDAMILLEEYGGEDNSDPDWE